MQKWVFNAFQSLQIIFLICCYHAPLQLARPTFKVLQKQIYFFCCDIFIFIFEKLASIGPVKLKIKLIWPYFIFKHRVLGSFRYETEASSDKI